MCQFCVSFGVTVVNVACLQKKVKIDHNFTNRQARLHCYCMLVFRKQFWQVHQQGYVITLSPWQKLFNRSLIRFYTPVKLILFTLTTRHCCCVVILAVNFLLLDIVVYFHAKNHLDSEIGSHELDLWVTLNVKI